MTPTLIAPKIIKQGDIRYFHTIHSITVLRMVDADPDTSWLGEYSDKRSSEFSIDRRCSYGVRSKTRYFNPSFNYVDKDGKPLPGETPETVRHNVQQDYERMEHLSADDWSFIGIKAVAEVSVSLDGGKTFKRDKLTSGGLWGIESDSDVAYLKSVEEEELAQLEDLLKAYGFGRSKVARAIKNAEREW